jgi:sigma-E factor negative regulatory protein RseB
MSRSSKLVIVFCLLWSSIGLADEQAMDLLKRMNQAANTLNYDGIFIHVDDQRIDTLRVIHKYDNGTVHERLYSLNGNPREVIRDAERVWCYMPEKNLGHSGLRSDKQSGFPGFMVTSLQDLGGNYEISTGGEDRIADRKVVRLKILPRDSYRYGYELWADSETGLLLKSVLIDKNSKVIEQYMFAQIDIGNEIPESSLLPMTSKTDLEWIKESTPPKMQAFDDSRWQFSSLPAGYELVSIMQKPAASEDEQVEHMVLSDGLAGVSVFIEKASPAMPVSGSEKMGAVNAYIKISGEQMFTVIGEVPGDTVKQIAEALVNKQ